MHTHRIVFALLLWLGVLAVACEAQVPDGPRPIVDVGFGVGAASQGFGGVLHVGVGTPVGDVILRSAGSVEFSILQTPESTADVALLYGRTLRGERAWARAAAGVGLVESVRRGAVVECLIFIACAYDEVTRRSAALALQADAVWSVSSWFGLGIGAFGSFGSAGSFGGGVLSLHVGRMR